MTMKRQVALGIAAAAFCWLVAGCGGRTDASNAANDTATDMTTDNIAMDLNSPAPIDVNLSEGDSNDVEAHHAPEPSEDAEGNGSSRSATGQAQVQVATIPGSQDHLVMPPQHLPNPPLPPDIHINTLPVMPIYTPPLVTPEIPRTVPVEPVRGVPFAAR